MATLEKERPLGHITKQRKNRQLPELQKNGKRKRATNTAQPNERWREKGEQVVWRTARLHDDENKGRPIWGKLHVTTIVVKRSMRNFISGHQCDTIVDHLRTRKLVSRVSPSTEPIPPPKSARSLLLFDARTHPRTAGVARQSLQLHHTQIVAAIRSRSA